jgi:hypothetical protein
VGDDVERSARQALPQSRVAVNSEPRSADFDYPVEDLERRPARTRFPATIINQTPSPEGEGPFVTRPVKTLSTQETSPLKVNITFLSSQKPPLTLERVPPLVTVARAGPQARR